MQLAIQSNNVIPQERAQEISRNELFGMIVSSEEQR